MTTLPPSVSQLSRENVGNLDVSQPYGPPRPVIGMALPFFTGNSVRLTKNEFEVHFKFYLFIGYKSHA
jgi:hypothetical protein